MTVPIATYDPNADFTAEPQPGPRETFLALFLPTKRGTIANWFLDPIRTQSATTPRQVLTCVLETLCERIDRAYAYGADYVANLENALDTINAHETEALGYAGWAIAWEQMPPDERERIKRRRQQEHQSAWMGERQPSQKQLDYLQRLGYRGPAPTSMLEASEHIDRLVKERQR